MLVTIDLDTDDLRDYMRAIVVYQRQNRWHDDQGGTLLPEGESDISGAIIGEICRDWLEARGELPQNAGVPMPSSTMKCPLCGAPPTEQRTTCKDAILPLEFQQCSNGACGLSWKLWERIDQLVQANNKYRNSLAHVRRAIGEKQ